MKTLIFSPDELPEREELIYRPSLRGASGELTFKLLKPNPEKCEFTAQAQFGMLLLKNVLNYEISSVWAKENGVWQGETYLEADNKKNKSREFATQKNCLDPLSVFYALRGMDRTSGSQVTVQISRGEKCREICFSVGQSKEMNISALGSGSRTAVQIIPQGASGSENQVTGFMSASLWIDQQTGVVVEMGYEVAPIGTLRVLLEKIGT